MAKDSRKVKQAGTHHHSKLIMTIAGKPYCKYCRHWLKAATAENSDHVAVGAPRLFLECLCYSEGFIS
jgi:hypothetical protein